MNVVIPFRHPDSPSRRDRAVDGRDADAGRPSVLIYAPHLLPITQHYIHEHAARLQRYRPVLVGRRRIKGISLDKFPNFAFNTGVSGRIRELHFLLGGTDGCLEAFVRQHNVRLVHAHFGPGGGEIMRVAARLDVPLVVTFHGWDAKIGEERRGSLYERLYRKRLPHLLRQAREVICVSDFLGNRVAALGCPREKLRTHYLGVDTALFDGIRVNADAGSIIYVGRLVRRKGLRVLLEAMRLLCDQHVDVKLTVVGDGPEKERLQAVARRQHLPIRFVGIKTQGEICDLLRSAMVLCAPSTTAGANEPEALGLVLLEAQAMRVPVVATRNGGMPEALVDGCTGILVEQESPAVLAEALATLIREDGINRSFGDAARHFVRERFDIAQSCRAMEDLYDSILKDCA
jgi:colanic acid/amylovoran biosynthesis glycosyltransferase